MKESPGSERTTIAAYGLAIQKALSANGYDAEDVFRAAGIDRMPSNDPMHRLTTSEVAAVFSECVSRTNNPAFGLTVARFLHPSALHALGYSLLASSTLRDACERLTYYFRMVSEQADILIREDQNGFILETSLKSDAVAAETIDAWHAFLIRLFRLIHSPDFSPIRVELARPHPGEYEQQYLSSFGASITFDAPSCRIILDPAVVDEPLMGGNREIALQNDGIIESYLAALEDSDLISRVRKLIIERLGSENCTRDAIARDLAMSPSSLQQKLAQMDTNFQDILAQMREKLALDYMEQSRYSITEISFMLGFSDTSSFNRAFRRWTGQSPTEYREGRGPVD